MRFLDDPQALRPDFELLRPRDIDTSRLVVFGRSLGGAVAAALLVAHPAAFRAAVLENTFTSIPDMASVLMPFLRHLLARLPVRGLKRTDGRQAPDPLAGRMLAHLSLCRCSLSCSEGGCLCARGWRDGVMAAAAQGRGKPLNSLVRNKWSTVDLIQEARHTLCQLHPSCPHPSSRAPASASARAQLVSSQPLCQRQRSGRLSYLQREPFRFASVLTLLLLPHAPLKVITPTLFVSSGRDEMVPPAHMRELWEKKRSPRSVWCVPIYIYSF